MRHARILIPLVALLLAGFVSAQDYVLHKFNLDQLGSQPGVIQLSPNYLSIIEFSDPIQSVATGRSDLVQVNVSGQRIILRPVKSVGKTDLIVEVNGKTALFRVDISSSDGTPRRYVVYTPQPPTPVFSQSSGGPNSLAGFPGTDSNASASANQVPSASSTTTGTSQPPHQTLQQELQARGIQGFSGDQASSTPTKKPAASSVTGKSVPFTFTAQVASKTDHALVIDYTLKNNGKNMVADDSSRLRLLDSNGNAVDYNIVRMNPDGAVNRVKAGYSEYGVIRVPNPPKGQVRVQWPIVEIGPGTTYTIDEAVLKVSP